MFHALIGEFNEIFNSILCLDFPHVWSTDRNPFLSQQAPLLALAQSRASEYV